MKLGPQVGPQTAFLSTEADIAIYGGAGGSGKTFALILETTRHIEVPGFSAVIFRREMPQIRNPGGLWDVATPIYQQLGGRANSQGASWRFPAGSVIKMSHLQLEDDKTSWDGAQIALVCFDELQHFSESQFWYLQSRNRSTCGVRPYTRATCNPDADSWLRSLLDWWIGPDGLPIPERSGVLRWFLRVENEMRWVDADTPFATSLTFIPADVRDNPALLSIDPGYLSRLRALESTERARLLHGNWNAKPDIRGRIYSAFQPEKHFLSHERAKILEREVLPFAQLWEGWDFGSGPNSATAIVWAYYLLSQDTLFVWDYVLEYELPFERYAELAAAKGYYCQCLKPNFVEFADGVGGKHPYQRVGDPAGKARDSTQRSWFANLADYCDIHLTPAQNRPLEAIATTNDRIGRGKVLLHPRCSKIGDALLEYRYNVPDNWDPKIDAIRAANLQPLKTWASHPCDALAYITTSIWGFMPAGYVPAQ